MRMKRASVLLIALVFVVSTAGAMTVEEAYRAIPHKKTDFDANNAGMNAQESKYLAAFFDLVNAAIVARVETLQWFSSKGSAGSSYENYKTQAKAVLSQLGSLDVPQKLTPVHQLTVAAITAQSAYYRKWEADVRMGKAFHFDRRDPLVAKSSRKLILAYKKLMTLYPKETERNKHAFFSHLCALDFI
jgi:hypothetical protein